MSGRGDIGDPDTDAGSDLRAAQGGAFRINGGEPAAGSHRLPGDTDGRTLPSGLHFARARFTAGIQTVVRTARALVVH